MAVAEAPAAARRVERLERIWAEPRGFTSWLTTTDHKRIGLLYLFTSLAFFLAGGTEALVMRTQLAAPAGTTVGPETFDRLFTIHGITMIFFFVIPLGFGAFGNYLVPLMLGARDMAFPRLNAFSYWVYLASGIFFYAGIASGYAPNAGWFDYLPLADRRFDPGANIDLYALTIVFLTVSTTAAAVNMIVTIFKLRAPGMSLNRVPLFCYAQLATAFALVFALPSLTAAAVFLELDRKLGFAFFDIGRGGDPVLWQHLFWIFGHPEVYIIVLPAFGIATSVIPTLCGRPMVAYPLVALAEILVAFIGFGVWVHHMFAVGLAPVATVFFAAASLMIVIPSGIQIFSWCTTMLTGTPRFKTPLLFIVGFVVFFVFGGLSGITFAAIPFDQQTTDTYYVVAHFHYVIFGAAVFPLFAGLYYWFPKVTGRLYHERAGQASFWLAFAGTNLTFFPQHVAGLLGMPRRVYTYEPGLGWDTVNLLSTIGAFLLASGLVLLVVNLGVSRFRGPPADDDPWGGETLEWATSSPPPAYNFAAVPRVTSSHPMWEAGDRARIREQLERGDLVLEEGHETVSTGVDGELSEVLHMPHATWWPVVIAVVLAGVFTMTLASHYVVAAILVGLALLATAGWHAREPEGRPA